MVKFAKGGYRRDPRSAAGFFKFTDAKDILIDRGGTKRTSSKTG